MSEYRMYFLVSNRIQAAENFEADGDADAIRIARVVWDACSDTCESFELWQAARLIRTRPPPYSGINLDDLNDRHQNVVIETEETIRISRGALARSQRLVEMLDGISGLGARLLEK